MEATMADVTDASAHFTDTGKALPVGAAYAHRSDIRRRTGQYYVSHGTPLSEAWRQDFLRPMLLWITGTSMKNGQKM